MAYVTDGHDPSGLGMFSKAGRYTSEKYIIFQRKDEILSNKKRVLKVQSYPSLGHKSKSNEIATKNIEEYEKKRKEKIENLTIDREENKPFYKQVSRELLNSIKSVKNPPKPVGYYHPRYTVLDKSQKMVWNILDVHRNEHKKEVPAKELPNEEELFTPIPEKPPSRVKGSVDIHRSLGRGEGNLLNVKGNPREERFEMLYLSQTWSNMRRPVSFNMRETVGREDNKMYKNKQFAPDYNPNFEYGKKGLGSCGPPLHKVPSRKPFHKAALTQNETFFDYDLYKTKSTIFRNTNTPDFKNYLPREMDPNSPLPSFMQKFVNSRTQLTHLSHKMLEENHYMDGRFQSTDSQFKPAAKPKQQADEDDSQDSIVYDR